VLAAVRRPSQGDRAIENHSCSQRKTSIRKRFGGNATKWTLLIGRVL